MINLLEVAIYAMVLTNPPAAFKCVADGVGGANCTNGLAAEVTAKGDIRFSNGVTVNKGRDGSVKLSNGVSTHFDIAGWVEFSSGVAVRRETPYRFRFSNGYVCVLAEKEMAECRPLN
jgi:hypothetical protein